MVHWDADGRKDLLAGLTDGRVKLFLNVATDADPQFDAGTFLQVGAPGAKSDITVGARATPIAVDWNADGRKDLLVGGLDGKLRLFLNEGTDAAPDFRTQQIVRDGGGDLIVPTGRSSPEYVDLDDDGLPDIATGNTEGQLLLYVNTGSPGVPGFSGYALVEADGTPINLPASPRSRPSVCDWTGDGELDVLLGAGDGLTYLYEGAAGAVAAPAGLPAIATAPRLLPAYPNPLGSGTTIPFVLARPARVRLAIFDAAGRTVARIADDILEPGDHHAFWNGRDESGDPVSAGAYFVRMETGRAEASGKLIVVR